MIPIHELLGRIRWDPAFARGRFELAYYDRVERKLIRVPIERVQFPAGDRFFVEAVAPDGEVRSVPLHRVREVVHDGAVIWRRHDRRH